MRAAIKQSSSLAAAMRAGPHNNRYSGSRCCCCCFNYYRSHRFRCAQNSKAKLELELVSKRNCKAAFQDKNRSKEGALLLLATIWSLLFVAANTR